MTSIAQIEAMARQHHGDLDARLAEHAHARSAEDLRAVSDDRYLALMTKCLFQSGFNWKVIEAKWDGFEAAFDGFDPVPISFYSDDDVSRLASDTRIVRNGQKIMATVANAGFVADAAREHGGFGAYLANWPVEDQIGLMDELNRRGSRLGAMTGQYFLRFAGWDAFILSRDVTAALIREGVIDKAPTSKKARAAVQAAFTRWRDESGLSQTAISRLLAFSVG